MRLTQSRCAHNFDRRNTRRNRSKSRLVHAAFEALENRQLMSGSAALVGGILTIAGDATASNNIQVNVSGTNLSATNGQGSSVTVAASSVKGIKITAGAGNDYIFIDQRITAPATISGGDGNDQIRGGGGVNTITDGNGSDWISGRGIANSITAGNGNDTLLGAAGADTLVAGNGNDSLDGADGNDSLTAGSGNDTITGDSGNDTIVAGNGKDSLNGGVGDDKITVGTGLSTLIPGQGTNAIFSGNKSDTIVASSGATSVTYGATLAASVATTSSAASATKSIATTTPTTTTTKTPSTSKATPSDAGQSPSPVIHVVSNLTTVGIAVVVDGLSSALGDGSAIDANYQWNFGDSAGEYNSLAGFNASHIYTNAGTYTISLTVTNDLDVSSTVSTDVTISGDNRRVIYVNSVHGSDSNSGSSTASPLRTAGAAAALVGNNTEVLFARGETFNLSAAFKLDASDILVGAYGSGAAPIMNYTAPASGSVIFTTNSSSADGVTVEDLFFTTLNGTQPTVANQPFAVSAGGYDTSVLRCTFGYVEYGVNASGAPVGLTVFDNKSPTNGGIQGYFVWDQGTDTVVVGNTINGSVKEHVMRTTGANNILVADNNFSNYDGKGCIEIHTGSYAWIEGNTVNSGDIRVGPLGLWGEPVDATSNCVIENNYVSNTDIAVYPGGQSISIRNNIIRNSGTMIDVMGQDGLGRQSSNIQIVNNTGISTGTAGQFLKVESYTAGIILENNLDVEPSLAVGAYNAAPVLVEQSDLSSFTYINGNVWQLPKTFDSSANGGVNYLNGTWVTSAVWDSESKVGTDYFYNVSVGSNGAPGVGSAVASIDSAVEGVFTDINGNARPGSGWTAGAIQV